MNNPRSVPEVNDLSDFTLTTKIFFVEMALFLLLAALQLVPWLGSDMVNRLFWGTLFDSYQIIAGFGLSFSIIYWGTKPSVLSQKIVLCIWPVISFSIWHLMASEFRLRDIVDQLNATLNVLTCAMFLSVLPFLLTRVFVWNKPSASPAFERQFRLLILLTFLFLLVPPVALALTSSLHPLSLDMYALHWDQAAGLLLAPKIVAWVNAVPGLQAAVESCYRMTPIGFFVVVLLQMHRRPAHVANAMLTWVSLTSLAFLAYNFFPVVGPQYIFGSGSFVNSLAHSNELPLVPVAAGMFPRNGVPSMHFGWLLAASILWWRTGTAWWSRLLIILMTVSTAIATLTLGEHYVVDLIVTVPFVLAAIALCTTSIAWKDRASTVIWGLLTWLVWVLVLRYSVAWAEKHAWFPWVMILLTALVVCFQTLRIAGFARLFASYPEPLAHAASEPVLTQQTQQAQQTQQTQNPQKKFERKIALMFFFSGFAALVYQVLFAKKLALVFGSTSTATITVLATFLGGMAIGSLIGGKLVQLRLRPLRTYALVEGGIALYCVFTPFIFDFAQTIYVFMAAGSLPEAGILTLLRVALGGMVLLVPTILMGVTLPLLAKVLETPKDLLGPKVALLYFVNTLGATVGALLTSYFIIPLLGVNSTTLLAALFNLLVALAGLKLAKVMGDAPVFEQRDQDGKGISANGKIVLCAFFALGIGGLLSLGMEVVYVHMLSIAAGNSTYAFGLMLATFLLGLSGGGEMARRVILQRYGFSVRWLALCFIGISLSIGLGLSFWNAIPDYFASFSLAPQHKSFVAMEAIRGLICAAIMLPPTIFIGAAYVFAMDILTSSAKNSIRMLSVGAAINTLGNILGALCFGFFILPWLGGFVAAKLIIGSTFLVGIAISFLGEYRFNIRSSAVAVLSSIGVIASMQINLDYQALSSGSNVYFAHQAWGEVLDHAESIDGGLTSVTRVKGSEYKTLLTNGKFQGNDAWQGEMQAQIGFAFAPLVYQEKRDHALVIGYGTGVTSRVFHEAGFKQLDIAELSGDIVNMANAHFSDVNKRVSSLPNVNLHITDGRNFLLLTPDKVKYDVISLEITSIWFAGAASLYNKEFYVLAKSKMHRDGVLQQWVQLHHLSPADILTVIATLRSEFQYVSLFEIGGQGVLIASNSEARSHPNDLSISALEQTEGLQQIRERFDGKISEISKKLLLNPVQIDQYLKKIGGDPELWISTDDNLSLEYSTPKGNARNAEVSYSKNKKVLSEFSSKSTN